MQDTDFLTVKNINNQYSTPKIFYYDWKDNQSMQIDLLYPNWEFRMNEITIQLNENYHSSIDILKLFINKVIEITDYENYPEQIIDYKTLHRTPTLSELKDLRTKLIASSSYIASNGRYGPAKFMIVPIKYSIELMKLEDHYNPKRNEFLGIKFISTDIIDDIIILGRKVDLPEAGIYGFYNKKLNRYKIGSIGDAKHQYHILKIKSLDVERKKKIEKINSKI